jgi:hypothetical protein
MLLFRSYPLLSRPIRGVIVRIVKIRGRRTTAIGACATVAVALSCLTGGTDALASEPAVPGTDRATTRQASDRLTGDIIFSVPGGTFSGTLSVSLKTSIRDGEIRYTTDGGMPTASSTVYENALSLTTTTQVRAQTFVSGTPSGAPGTAVYIARSFDARHDLPLLVLDAYGAGRPQHTFKDIAAMVISPQNGVASLSTAPDVATRAGYHLRGQSSLSFDKEPYRLELRDNDDKDADYPLLGMPADADWVLRGPFPDKTLIRDAFAYTLGGDMGLRAPRFAFVEVYLNVDAQPLAASDYQGVYMLVETIENSPHRLGLSQLTDKDVAEPAVSGGYVLQFNFMATDHPTLTCARKRPEDACWSDLEVIDPDPLLPQQKAWITTFIQNFHDSLRSENPADPRTGYPAYIDVDSFVDRIIHNELSREGDAYLRSTHFFKDRNGKLVAGPLWDYDLGYAAFTGSEGFEVPPLIEGWQYQPVFDMSTSDWFTRLMREPTFRRAVRERWQELRGGVLSDAQLTARVDTLASRLTAAADRNFRRWPILDKAVVGPFRTQVTQTWQEQLQIMRTFLTQRAAWIDGSGWDPDAPGVPVPTGSIPGWPPTSAPAPR